MAYSTQRPEHHDSRVPTYHAEHMTAWVLALAAIALGILGVFRGFGIIGGDEQTAGAAGDATTLAIEGNVADGFVWLLPAVAAGLLALSFHRSDHHFARQPETLSDAHEGMWKGEHAGAYLMGAVSVVLGALALLVGFDVFNRGNDQADGMIWGLAAVGSGALTATLHSVRHHQLASDVDYILNEVERRAQSGQAGAGQRTTSAERSR